MMINIRSKAMDGPPDPLPDDPNPNKSPARLTNRQDNPVLLNSPPVCSKTLLPEWWSSQANEESTSSHSANEQPGDSKPMDTSEVMVQSGTVRNMKKCLRIVVKRKPAQGGTNDGRLSVEGKNEELKSSYELLKTKSNALEEKRFELEKEKQRADELTANREQILTKHQVLEARKDQLEKDNRELTERLEQQSKKIAELQQQSCSAQQLKVTVSEMQSSLLRATEQLAQVQEKNAIVVTGNDVLRQQIRDKDELLDEYRSMDMKVQG